MANDQKDGFLLEGEARGNVNAGGGRSRLQFIAIANSAEDAISIVERLGFPTTEIIESGPAILARAKESGVHENDMSASKRPRDTNQLGKLMVDILTGQVEDSERTPEERGVAPT